MTASKKTALRTRRVNQCDCCDVLYYGSGSIAVTGMVRVVCFPSVICEYQAAPRDVYKAVYVGNDIPSFTPSPFLAMRRGRADNGAPLQQRRNRTRTPHVRGDACSYIVHTSCQEAVFDHIVSHVGGWDGVRAHEDRGLDCPVALTEPCAVPSHSRGVCNELLFEVYGATGVMHITSSAAAALNVAGLKQKSKGGIGKKHAAAAGWDHVMTCLVIDIGHSSTTVLPIVDGTAVGSAVARCAVGTSCMQDHLKTLIAARHPGLDLGDLAEETIADLFQECGVVASDYGSAATSLSGDKRLFAELSDAEYMAAAHSRGASKASESKRRGDVDGKSQQKVTARRKVEHARCTHRLETVAGSGAVVGALQHHHPFLRVPVADTSCPAFVSSALQGDYLHEWTVADLRAARSVVRKMRSEQEASDCHMWMVDEDGMELAASNIHDTRSDIVSELSSVPLWAIVTAMDCDGVRPPARLTPAILQSGEAWQGMSKWSKEYLEKSELERLSTVMIQIPYRRDMGSEMDERIMEYLHYLEKERRKQVSAMRFRSTALYELEERVKALDAMRDFVKFCRKFDAVRDAVAVVRGQVREGSRGTETPATGDSTSVEAGDTTMNNEHVPSAPASAGYAQLRAVLRQETLGESVPVSRREQRDLLERADLFLANGEERIAEELEQFSVVSVEALYRQFGEREKTAPKALAAMESSQRTNEDMCSLLTEQINIINALLSEADVDIDTSSRRSKRRGNERGTRKRVTDKSPVDVTNIVEGDSGSYADWEEKVKPLREEYVTLSRELGEQRLARYLNRKGLSDAAALEQEIARLLAERGACSDAILQLKSRVFRVKEEKRLHHRSGSTKRIRHAARRRHEMESFEEEDESHEGDSTTGARGARRKSGPVSRSRRSSRVESERSTPINGSDQGNGLEEDGQEGSVVNDVKGAGGRAPANGEAQGDVAASCAVVKSNSTFVLQCVDDERTALLKRASAYLASCDDERDMQVLIGELAVSVKKVEADLDQLDLGAWRAQVMPTQGGRVEPGSLVMGVDWASIAGLLKSLRHLDDIKSIARDGDESPAIESAMALASRSSRSCWDEASDSVTLFDEMVAVWPTEIRATIETARRVYMASLDSKVFAKRGGAVHASAVTGGARDGHGTVGGFASASKTSGAGAVKVQHHADALANQIRIGSERIRACEVLFQPHLGLEYTSAQSTFAKLEYAGLMETIHKSMEALMRSPIANQSSAASVASDERRTTLKKRVLQTVILTGGGAALPGLGTRLLLELESMFHMYAEDAHVLTSRAPLLDAWRGCAKLARCSLVAHAHVQNVHPLARYAEATAKGYVYANSDTATPCMLTRAAYEEYGNGPALLRYLNHLPASPFAPTTVASTVAKGILAVHPLSNIYAPV